jgi:mono/diheme cytochrome c family protein
MMNQKLLFITVMASAILMASFTLYAAEIGSRQGARIYGQYCTPCHGKKGQGDGTRARSEQLDPRPRVHANGVYMNRIPDMRLFRIIKFGGESMGFSHIMPSWKHILKDEDIIKVISHIRSLASPPYLLGRTGGGVGCACRLPRPEDEKGPIGHKKAEPE